MALVKDYFKKHEHWTKEYGENTVVLMQVGAFYEIYGKRTSEKADMTGSRIVDVCAFCDLNITNKNPPSKSGANGVSDSSNSPKELVFMAGFRDYQLDKYLRKICDMNWTAVVYNQDENTSNTTRSLTGVYTKGTYFDSESQSISNTVMVMYVNLCNASKVLRQKSKIIIGIAIVDIFTGQCSIQEFITDTKLIPSSFDEIERIVSVHRPNESILIGNMDIESLRSISCFVGLNEETVRIVDMADKKAEVAERARKSEKQQYQYATLLKFYENNEVDAMFYDMAETSYALQAYVFLLDYISLHNPDLTSRLRSPKLHSSTRTLTLANHSLKQLNMITDGRSDNTKLSCITSLLNVCKTAMGKRGFKGILLNPITDEHELQSYYDMTEYWLETNVWTDIRNMLSNINDLEKKTRVILTKKFTPRDFAIVHNSLTASLQIINRLNISDTCITTAQNNQDIQVFNHTMEYLTRGSSLETLTTQIRDILSFIEKHIIVEEAKFIESNSFGSYATDVSNKGSSFIQYGVYEDLDAACSGGLVWQAKASSLMNWLQSLIDRSNSKKAAKLQIKLHETASNAPTIQMTKIRGQALKLELEKMKGVNERLNSKMKTHAKTQAKSVTKKVENELMPETNNSSYDANDVFLSYIHPVTEKEEKFTVNIGHIHVQPATSKSEDMVTGGYITEILSGIQNSKNGLLNILVKRYTELCNQFQEYNDAILDVASFLERVDSLQARCYLANRYGYCKPTIDKREHSFVSAKDLRHPLIEEIQTRETYVTNDLELGCGDTNGILLYGTNAVGKTSLIKALGISVIMAQAGLYVPCSEFRYSPYHSIFTRILGIDDIHRGLSTFAVEMMELRTILCMANKNSLILGDELCSGTESNSALSIFTSGLEDLHNRDICFIFATHFHEIVDYDEIKCLDKLAMKHMSVIYNKETGELIYDRKLKDGPGEGLYGLEVCKALDLPRAFLERAHEIRIKYDQKRQPTLSHSGSHFNQKKVRGNCEMCGKKGTEVHHLQHQKNANSNGRFKNGLHKNHPANLMNICEDCHNSIHDEQKQHRKVKTTNGYKLMELETDNEHTNLVIS